MGVINLPGQTLLRGIREPRSMQVRAYRAHRSFREGLGVNGRGTGTRSLTKHETRKPLTLHFVSLHRGPIGPPKRLISHFEDDQCSIHSVRKGSRSTPSEQTKWTCSLQPLTGPCILFPRYARKILSPRTAPNSGHRGQRRTNLYILAIFRGICTKLYARGSLRNAAKPFKDLGLGDSLSNGTHIAQKLPTTQGEL